MIYKGSKQIKVDTSIKVTGTVKKDFSTTAAKDFLGAELNDTGWYATFSGEPYIAAKSLDTDVAFPGTNE